MNGSERFAIALAAMTCLGCASSQPTESDAKHTAEAARPATAVETQVGKDTPDDPVARVTAAPANPEAGPEPTKGFSPSIVKKLKPTRSLDELLLFFPSKHPDGNWNPPDLTFEDVWFTAEDGTRIHGWYCPCEQPRAILLYAHGNAGNLSDRSPLLARFQAQMRVAVLIFDYRGYGRSSGTPTAKGILEDARAARTFLAQQAGVEESEIVLMGRSLGGAVVTQLAGEARSRGLILESTFSSLRDAATHHYPKLAWLVPRKKLDSASQISRYQGPLLQSHGDADRTIPFASGMKLFRAANEPKVFVTISGADHNDPQTEAYYEQWNRFIENLSEH